MKNSIPEFRFFLWNDKRSEGLRWQKTIENTFPDYAVAKLSQAKEPEQIYNEYLEANPDFVILDIVDGNRAPGAAVVQLIRKEDPFIPIVAVTKYPHELYRNDATPVRLGFNGVFDPGVMNLGNFQRLVFTPVLAACHKHLPEFELFRKIGLGLQPFQSDDSTGQYFKQLWEMLRRLPHTGNRDNWHAEVCRTVAALLKSREYHDLARALNDVGALFRAGDRYYMAAGLSRKHVSHNVQVFLLGVVIMLGDTELREVLSATDTPCSPGRPSCDCMLDCILLWACAALTHDVGYFVQYRDRIRWEIERLDQEFTTVMAGNPLPKPGEPQIKQGEFHAEVGARFWTAGASANERTAAARRLIAAAIRRHDSSYGSPQPVPTARWMEFLAVLCDELQDWGRERSEAEPGTQVVLVKENDRPVHQMPFEFHGIHRIFVGRRDGTDVIEIGFTADSYPDVITTSKGVPGTGQPKNRLDAIQTCICRQLCVRGSFELRLAFEMISDLNRKPDWKTARFHQVA